MVHRVCTRCGVIYAPSYRPQIYCTRQCAAQRRALTDAEFLSLVVKEDHIRAPHLGTPCWVFTGYINPRNGYGQISAQTAHRRAFKIANGFLPSLPHQVLHHCDVKLCCRPDHLYVGDQKQNTADAKERHRLASVDRTKHCGASNGRAKLNDIEVAAIRSEFSELERKRRRRIRRGSLAELASRYGVSIDTIARIGRNKSWLNAQDGIVITEVL